MLYVTFAIGALVALIGVHCVDVARETNILPPSEFPAAGLAFEYAAKSKAVVWFAGALFCVVAGFLFRKGALAHRVALVVASVGQLIQPIHGAGSLVTLIGLFALFLAQSGRRLDEHPARDRIASGVHALSGTRAWKIWGGWSEVIGLPMLVMAALTIAEVFIYTRPRVLGVAGAAGIVDAATLWKFVAFAGSAGALVGARLGLELMLMLLTARALIGRGGLLRIVVWGILGFGLTMWVSGAYWAVTAIVAMLFAMDRLLAARPHPAVRLIALTLVGGLYMYARCVDLGVWAVGDILNMLHMQWALPVLFGAFVLPMAIWTQKGLEQRFAEDPPSSPSGVVQAIVTSLLTPFGRSSVLFALPYCGLMVWFLLGIEYPEQDDYSQVGLKAYTGVIGLATITTAAMLYLAAGRRFLSGTGGRLFVGALLLLAVGCMGTWQDNNTQRMLAFRYAKIGRWAVQMTDPLPAWKMVEAAAAVPDVELGMDQPAPLVPAAIGTSKPPIIIILWDAVRADHLPAYGYDRKTSPTLDRLAQEGVVFENARSSSTATGSSLRHLFTGRFSSRYSMEPDHAPFFTGTLIQNGYDQVFANVTGSDMNGVGIETFQRNHEDPRAASLTVGFTPYEESQKVEQALALIDGRTSDHFLMFIHFLAPHYPWLHYDEVDDFGPGLADRYDESVLYTDFWTRKFLDGLRERKLYDDAIIVVTADHGTGLADHGAWGGFEPYEEQIRVPLIMKVPGIAPRRVPDAVSGIDLAPTLLSLVTPGVETGAYHGLSLVGAMAGQPLARRYTFHIAAFDDTFAVIDHQTQQKLIVMRTFRYALLYDLKADPTERHNLSDEQPEETSRLLGVAQNWLDRGQSVWDVPYYYLPYGSER